MEEIQRFKMIPYGYAQGTSREVMKKICMNIRWNEQLDVHHNQLPAAVLVRLDHIWFINHAAVWVWISVYCMCVSAVLVQEGVNLQNTWLSSWTLPCMGPPHYKRFDDEVIRSCTRCAVEYVSSPQSIRCGVLDMVPWVGWETFLAVVSVRVHNSVATIKAVLDVGSCTGV